MWCTVAFPFSCAGPFCCCIHRALSAASPHLKIYFIEESELSMPVGIVLLIVVVVAAVALCGGFYLGEMHRKKTAEAKIGSAEEEAVRLVNEAIKTAEQKRKESVLEAKDEVYKMKAEVDEQKAEADREIKQRRAEITRQENRIDQKENALDRKTEALERREEDLKKRTEQVDVRLAEIDQLRAKQLERLETLAGLSQEDAREVLLHKVDEELVHEKAVRVAAYESNLKDECDNIARNLIGQAVSRCAADHSGETTVSVVPLPSDEMKGRIIGREGRNIRALETATGVDLIIDDTPEAITLSSFDQTRREVARMTLERLIGDGRIHPARIEETVEKCRHDLELQMKREGERAVMDLGIHGLHPDLVKLIGRLKYRTSFGQNALTHSMEVAWLSGLLAGEMGVNVTMARRAGLLHDIGKALDHEIEGSHVQIGVDICRKYKENTQIIHAIEAHHGDVEPKTLLAFIVQAADAISAARPGARRENVESYVKRLENLEEISSGFEGVEQAFAVQAGREVRIMVKPEVISDDQVVLLARSIAKKIEDTLDYPGQIKVNVIRESRAIEYAK
jgi:ribonuclease Y